jgi:hypothetical protein
MIMSTISGQMLILMVLKAYGCLSPYHQIYGISIIGKIWAFRNIPFAFIIPNNKILSHSEHQRAPASNAHFLNLPQLVTQWETQLLTGAKTEDAIVTKLIHYDT